MSNDNFVDELIKDYQNFLWLNDWTIKKHLDSEPFTEDGEVDQECPACVRLQPQYLYANLHIFPQFWIQTDVEQEIDIIHELVHIMFAPLYGWIPANCSDQEDMVVQKFTMLIYKMKHNL